MGHFLNDLVTFIVWKLFSVAFFMLAVGLFAGGQQTTTVPLTAETITLQYFNKGYTKELKKNAHLLPACRQLKLKNIRSKDKAELTMLLAKELLLRKHVILAEHADFYCLH